jgi:serine phosphatase RsbU (regulator of sigma subunit)
MSGHPTQDVLGDGPPPESFQRLVDLAVELVGASHGFLTVVDGSASWQVAATALPEEMWSESEAVEASFCTYVIESRETLFVDAAATHPTSVVDHAIESMGVQAWGAAPISDPMGHVVGSLCVVDTEPHRWTDRDKRVVETLARSAADEVARLLAAHDQRAAEARADAARAEVDDLIARQRGLLELMQRSLLPTNLPTCEGLDVEVRYESANSTSELGGDWYDVIDLGERRTGFVLADVSGHDAEAVAVMAELRPSLHVFARSSDRPSVVLADLHDLMVELAIPRFLTIFYGVWDAPTRTLTYQCAGHPPPVFRGNDGAARQADFGASLLGVRGVPPSTQERTVLLQPGSSVVVFTDGLFEQPRRSLDEGLEEVRRIVETGPAEPAHAIADHLMAHAQPNEGWFDDIALLVLRATPSAA